MLAYLSKFESKMSQVGTKLVQDGSKLPKLASEKKRFSVRKKPVDAKLAPNLHLKGPGASPRGWDMRMLRQQGRSKIDVFYLHINSHNFHNRKRQLTYLLSKNRSPQDAKVASKTFQNDPKSTPKATTNDPQKILSAYAFQPPASEICLCRSKTRSVRRRYPRLRVQYMYVCMYVYQYIYTYTSISYTYMYTLNLVIRVGPTRPF